MQRRASPLTDTKKEPDPCSTESLTSIYRKEKSKLKVGDTRADLR